jgi:hypothetical protein
MNNQKQVKIGLSLQLNRMLQEKAEFLGVPVTQYIKYIILKELEIIGVDARPSGTAEKLAKNHTLVEL